MAQGGPPNNETLIQRFDRNGDGKISKDEWHGRLPFEHFDANGDGQLTLDELNRTRTFGRSRAAATSAETTAFDGSWVGHGEPSSMDCAANFDIEFKVAGGTISGELVAASDRTGDRYPSDITGTVKPNGNAVLTLKPKGPGSFSGKQRGKFEDDRFAANLGGRNCRYDVSMTKR